MKHNITFCTDEINQHTISIEKRRNGIGLSKRKEYSSAINSKFFKYTQTLRAVMDNVYLFK
jgi:hypothetical protein